eukprot:TRINITY_DN6211_c0_g1_i2.p1 TRINITY_DN6211_c0_g1~~TRINITY_DN6211_c0_g1_i2.p1  ORF type:complete len:102 (-),score=16.23 TRINITY_DN6211_c0_g1_i2:658-963(-)
MDLHKKVREQDRIDFIRHISHFFTELQGRVNSKSATMRSTLTNLDERFDDQIEEIDELNHRSSQYVGLFSDTVHLGYLFIYLFIDLFIYLFIYFFIYFFIY